MSVVEPERGVQPDGDPDAVAHPRHLADLRLLPRVRVEALLHRHGLGVDDEDAVAVSAPHLVVHLDHGPDGVVRLAQVQEVVVGQVPLSVGGGAVEDGDGAVGQRA